MTKPIERFRHIGPPRVYNEAVLDNSRSTNFAMEEDFPPNVETVTFKRTDILRRLRIEHRELDEEIKRLQEDPWSDELALRRLKKQKLRLKDLIAHTESSLIPDLDA